MTERGRRATDKDMSVVLDQFDVAMVCGSGGVGKTSIAASLAVSEALRGRKVCVLTIDPARRLATAMGLDSLDDREREVHLPHVRGAPRGGSLHALMLDSRKALDRLVAETATDAESRDRIYANRVYQQVSLNTVGMQEYMALERLYEIDRSGRYDLVVVDTPPAAHARDLLESPYRMLRFLEGRSLRWFLKPGMRVGKFGLRAIGGSGGPVLGVIQRVTGVELLRDTTEFFEAFEGMYDAFAERIRIVERLFTDKRTGFLVVTSPERESIDEAIDFFEMLVGKQCTFAASVVNRVDPTTAGTIATAAELGALPGIDDDLARRIAAAQADHASLAERDEQRVSELRHAVGGALTVPVPRLARLITDLDGLLELRPYLYA